mmetsp:Transcript_12006/g.44647  ORF Transcript_12006/g.44647 Transcript_12006/m.44647 type:complete len:200 (-) Transcript_12006:556-1155(-)
MVLEVFLVLLLFRCEVHDVCFTSRRVGKHVPVDFHVLPNNKRLHGAHLKTHQCLFNTEAVLTAVLCNLIEELPNQFLFLDELDVTKGVRAQFDRLRKPVFAAVRNIHNHQNNRSQPHVEKIALHELVLEIRAPSHNKPVDVRPVVRDEVRGGELGDFPDVVLALLQAQAGETQRGLTTSAVLLRQIHGDFVNNLSVVAR